MKKFLVLILALSMAMTASAFAALPVGLELAPTPEDYAYTDLSEHKTIVMYLVGDGESTYPDFPEILGYVNEELAKFNTSLEVTVISWSDADTMYPLILTGGEKADLIFTATWRNLWTGAADESFYQMDLEFIEKYMPYTFQYQPAESFVQTSYLGDIIAISQNMTPNNPSYVAIRTDLAEEYGLSTDIMTWDDLKAYWYGIAEHTEETGIFAYNAGKTDRVVNSLVARIYDLVSAGDFRFVRHETEGTPSADDLVFYYTSEWFEFVVNESYELCQAGIWSRSALSKTENASQSFQNGISATMQWNNSCFQYMTYLEEQILGVERESATAVVLLNSDKYPSTPEAFNNNDMSILASTQDPYRAAMVLDILKFNTTLNTMICKGIEGRHFIDLGDGYYQNGPEYESYTPDGMSWAWALQNDNWRNMPNRQDQMEWDAYVRENAAVNPTAAFVFDSEPIAAYYAAYTAAITEYQYTLGLGMVDDPAAALADFLEILEDSGMEQYINEYKAQYQAWYDTL